MAVKQLKVLLAAGLLLAFAATANATGYVEVLSGAQTTGGNTELTTTRMSVCEGTTTYHFLADNTSPQDLAMNKVSGVGTSPVTSTITTLASWTVDVGAPAGSRVFTGYGMEIVGDSIQIIDSSNDAIYRVNKSTGAVSVYVAKSVIDLEAGASAEVNNWNGVSPTGEAVFYEGASDSIMITSGAGSITTLVSSAQLAAAQSGTTSISSGLTYDGSGNLYWGENTTDKLYMRASDGTIGAVLDADDLDDFIGTNVSFSGDVYYAPDGFIYFRAGTSNYQSVLRFDPADADPASTLETFLSNADLVNGPAASAFVLGMSWYNGNLAWTTSDTPYYAVPEPASLALMAFGGLALLRRRR